MSDPSNNSNSYQYQSETPRGSDTAPLGTPTQATGTYPQPSYQQSETPRYAQPEAPQYSQPEIPTYPQQLEIAAQKKVKPASRHMGSSLVGPVILILAGLVLLLNNIGVLPWAIWGDLWRLWPLGLIVVGLDLIIGRRRPGLSLALMLLIVVVGGGLILYAGYATRGDVIAYKLNIASPAATSARVEIDFDAGTLNVDSALEGVSIATGSLDYFANRNAPRANLDVNDGRADISIASRDNSGFNFDWFGSSPSFNWDVHLSPRLPMSINADLGTGNSTLDLSGLNLTGLDLDVGTGNTTVDFPKPKASMEAKIDGGIGNLTLSIPDGVAARISVDSGIGNVDVDDRFVKHGEDTYETANYASSAIKLDLKIDAGVGNVEVGR